MNLLMMLLASVAIGSVVGVITAIAGARPWVAVVLGALAGLAVAVLA